MIHLLASLFTGILVSENWNVSWITYFKSPKRLAACYQGIMIGLHHAFSFVGFVWLKIFSRWELAILTNRKAFSKDSCALMVVLTRTGPSGKPYSIYVLESIPNHIFKWWFLMLFHRPTFGTVCDCYWQIDSKNFPVPTWKHMQSIRGWYMSSM